MVRYLAAAAALRCFSAAPAMRRLYRGLGNGVGNRRRSAGSIPGYYVERLDRMLTLVKRHGIVANGDRILELGTGWLHWEALTLRLFFDIEAVLFDVWDNRQLGGMKNYLGQLKPVLNTIQGLSDSQVRRAQFLIDQIVGVESFEELYRLLGFEYVVDPSGSLERFADCSFQLVVSAGVLEHVNRGALPTLIAETRRLLRPGGWALHSIDTSDHLAHYDKTVSAKKYLCFSETTWQRFFDNEVQGINRVQRGEWLEMFRGNGFALVDADGKRVDISGLKLAERFAHLDQRDLEYTVVRLALKAC
jgi:SAM-dependent methyltransferase